MAVDAPSAAVVHVKFHVCAAPAVGILYWAPAIIVPPDARERTVDQVPFVVSASPVTVALVRSTATPQMSSPFATTLLVVRAVSVPAATSAPPAAAAKLILYPSAPFGRTR
jgi:hypothetical protein